LPNDKDANQAYSKAIAKIEAEIASSKGASYAKAIGNFLLQHINAHPWDAAKILDEGKTIKGSFDAMRKVAEKQKVAGYAFLTDAEGFATVIKYYGIDAGADPVQEQSVVVPERKASEIDFNVSLDDLL
jgi:hypothetical protein